MYRFGVLVSHDSAGRSPLMGANWEMNTTATRLSMYLFVASIRAIDRPLITGQVLLNARENAGSVSDRVTIRSPVGGSGELGTKGARRIDVGPQRSEPSARLLFPKAHD